MGGTAPNIAPWFTDWQHETWFYWYVSLPIFLSALVYGFMGDTRHTSEIDRD